MDRRDKIQHLLITHLMEKGTIELTLPDGLMVEMGILKENKHGDLAKQDDYSWIIASQKDRTVSMDSYTFSVRYPVSLDKMLIEESTENQDGQEVKVLMAV